MLEWVDLEELEDGLVEVEPLVFESMLVVDRTFFSS